MESTVEDWVVGFLKKRSEATFKELTLAGIQTLGVSRATFARHLAMMVDHSSIVKMADGRYALPMEGLIEPPILVRFHRVESLRKIFYDGRVYDETATEMSVVRGVVPHLTLNIHQVNKTLDLSQLGWSCSRPAHLEIRPFDSARPTVLKVRLIFDEPMTSRDSAPVRYFIARSSPNRAWMYRGGPPPEGVPSAEPMVPQTMDSFGFGVPSRSSPTRHAEFSEDGHILLRVIFPGGYPLGKVLVDVQDGVNPTWKDNAEIERLTISKPPSDPLQGLRVWDNVALLRVENPLLDRSYYIQWELPDERAFHRWQHRRRDESSSSV